MSDTTDGRETGNAADGEAELERALAAARAHPPEPSGDFMARLMADAEAAVPDAAAPAAARPARRGWLARAVAVIGGWPVVAGLAAAACAGLWIGVTAPAAVETALGAGAESFDVSDLLFDVDALWEEG